MQPELRRILTQGIKIGDQIKFTKVLEDWQAKTYLSLQSDSLNEDLSEHNSAEGIDLRKILNITKEGQYILNLHLQNTELNDI